MKQFDDSFRGFRGFRCFRAIDIHLNDSVPFAVIAGADVSHPGARDDMPSVAAVRSMLPKLRILQNRTTDRLTVYILLIQFPFESTCSTVVLQHSFVYVFEEHL